VAHASRSIYASHVRSIFGRSGVPLFGPGVRSCAVRHTGPNSSIRNTTANIEPASQVLAQTNPVDVPADCASLVETEEEIPYHTRYYRKRGRPSMKEKAQGQQYLTHPRRKLLLLSYYGWVQSGLLYVSSIYLHLHFASLADVPRTDPPNHRTRIGLRPSVAATPRSNRGIIGLCRGSVMMITYITR
jgi:hypothetical protein